MDCGYKHYKELMQKFDTVIDVFLALDPKFQAVIADITKRMGAGMAKFITKDVSHMWRSARNPVPIADYACPSLAVRACTAVDTDMGAGACVMH